MADWDLLLTEARIATMRPNAPDYGVTGGSGDGVIAVKDGHIAWIGKQSDLSSGSVTESRSVAGRWVTPALIDCHTHLVFAGDRAAGRETCEHVAIFDLNRRAILIMNQQQVEYFGPLLLARTTCSASCKGATPVR